MLDRLTAAAAQIETVVLGKSTQIRLSLACLLAGGHLLIEDVPGVGKTTLSHTLARVLGLRFNRVQFTNDLLPADLLGLNVFDRDQAKFQFHPGPVFTQVLLADEINRASPKTQSALLEAMEERQVSLDGVTHKLPQPFFVIATQNPGEQIGTFALPESQLDRFLMCLSLGYPDPTAERQLLMGENRRTLIADLPVRLSPDDLITARTQLGQVRVSAALIDYLQGLLAESRRRFAEGLSPRAGLALLSAARAWALLDGRDHVLPDDIQAVLPAVAGHRLRDRDGGAPQAVRARWCQELIEAVKLD